MPFHQYRRSSDHWSCPSPGFNTAVAGLAAAAAASTLTTGDFSTVAGGRLYSGDQYGFYAFDAGGSSGCSGTPKVCSPLWTYSTSNNGAKGVALANGVLYVGSSSNSSPFLAAFDATGSSGCAGVPKVCSPLWQSVTVSSLGIASTPAVANGVVFIGSAKNSVYAFDAAGSTGCSGTPRVCNPPWSSSTGSQVRSSPAVANGTVWIGSEDHLLYAFK